MRMRPTSANRNRISALLVCLLATTARAEWQPVDRLQFLVVPDQAVEMKWRRESADGPGTIQYEISDFQGHRVAAGEAQVHDGRLAVPMKLARGYYEIAFPAGNQRFGICAVPQPPASPDPFFCMDSALSWLDHRQDIRASVARMLKRIGVAVSRERVRWRAIHPAADQWDWQTGDRYEDLRRICAEAGLGVLEMAHDAPGWMGPSRANPFPQDLAAAARSWSAIERRWHPYWSALEIWNEPDVHFGGHLPADQYVPLVHAIAYGLRDARPAVTLVGGVLTDICPDEYRRACALNGLLDSADIISFHTYTRADKVQPMAELYRAWLKAAGKETMPLWITESGRPWKKGPGRPPMFEDAESALDIVTKAIEARACGIAAYYAFVCVYYEENTHNFGMLGKEVTPLRSFAAYAQAVAALAHKPYRGDLAVLPAQVQRARVFGDAADAVVVLYTGRIDPKARVRLNIPVKRVEGVDGRALTPEADGQIPIPDGLAYVWIAPELPADALATDTTANRLYALSRQIPPKRPSPTPIILQYRHEPQRATATTRGYTVTPAQAADFEFTARVHNLSDRGRRVELSMDPAGDSATAPPQSVEVPAAGFMDVRWKLNLAPRADAQGQCTLTIKGRVESPERVSPLSIDFKILHAQTRPQDAGRH